jgi:hypothetical protein
MPRGDGSPGREPAFPVAADEPRAVDLGSVIVTPDAVKAEAPPSAGRKEVWTVTAVVLVEGLRSAVAEATAEDLWSPVAALLLALGVLRGVRRLWVLGDGATWIRTSSRAWGYAPRLKIVCWDHLRNRCGATMSAAGGRKDRRRAWARDLRGQLWQGEVDAAVDLLRGRWNG